MKAYIMNVEAVSSSWSHPEHLSLYKYTYSLSKNYYLLKKCEAGGERSTV